MVPRARVAAISTFSVAPTETKGKSTTAPLSPVRRGRVDVAVAQVELGAERLEAAQVQVDGPRADGAAAGQRDDGMAVAREHRPEHQDRGAHLADDVVVGAVVGDRLGADDQHAALLQARDLAAERTASSAVIVRMSESRGALVSVTGSSVSSAAGISVRQAFLAPEIGIDALQPVAAVHENAVHVCLSSFVLVVLSRRPRRSSPPRARARFCALRRARLARSACARRSARAVSGRLSPGLRRFGRLAHAGSVYPKASRWSRSATPRAPTGRSRRESRCCPSAPPVSELTLRNSPGWTGAAVRTQ